VAGSVGWDVRRVQIKVSRCGEIPTEFFDLKVAVEAPAKEKLLRLKRARRING